MPMHYFLVIDAGTGSGRAVVFDAKGNQLGIGQEEWTHLKEENVPGSMGFDCENNWKLLCRCIKQALKSAKIKGEQVRAVSASSMREGIVVYDKDGNEIWGVANVDSRSSKEVSAIKAAHPDMEASHYKTSGQTFALGALPRLLWLKKNKKALFKKAEMLSMLSDWVLYKLSGSLACDPSNAGTAGMFSLKRRKWAPSHAVELGIPETLFPPCVESGTVIGNVDLVAAKATTLKTGTPVVMGGGDVQLGCAGLGLTKPGQVAVLGGTFWQQLVNTSRPVVDRKMQIRINPHVIPALYQAEGITFFPGLVMRWFRDAFCEKQIEEAKKRGVDPYTVLEEMASDVPPGSYGIVPVFSDAMNYGKWYHAAPSLLNLSLDPEKSGKAAIFRALQENAAIVSAVNLDRIFKLTKAKCDEIVFAAGASKGFLWPQILADVTGKRIRIPVVKEATSLGGMMLCAVATGVYANMDAAAEAVVQWEKTFEPDPDNHKIYSGIRKKWEKAYKAQLALVDEGVTDSMWKAPGI